MMAKDGYSKFLWTAVLWDIKFKKHGRIISVFKTLIMN